MDNYSSFFHSGARAKEEMTSKAKSDVFSAIALGIIDNVLTHQPMDSQLLNKLLKAHLGNIVNSNPVNEMQKLIRRTPRTELAMMLGATLKVMAEERMKQEPGLEGSAIEAIARMLNLRIEVREVVGRKTLPARYIYPKDADSNSKIEVSLDLNNGDYTSRVRKVGKFQPIELIRAGNRENDKIDISIKESYQRNANRLSTMLKAGEIDERALVGCYLACVPSSSYLSGHFYNDKPIDPNNILSSVEDNISNLIIDALATKISRGELSEQQVFAAIPERSLHRKSM